MSNAPGTPVPTLRPLQLEDLGRLLAIDQAHTGSVRRRFIEKRLAAVQSRPDDFLHVGVELDGSLVGFALGRLLYGEFGQREPIAVLDAMGVDPSSQEHGLGHALIEAVRERARAKGVRWLHSQAEWMSHGLLRLFASSAFTLAQRVVLERGTSEPMVEAGEPI